MKKADDPEHISRLSLGGSPEIGGYYCVYRGSKEAAIACLEQALKSLKAVADVLGPGIEPELTPE